MDYACGNDIVPLLIGAIGHIDFGGSDPLTLRLPGITPTLLAALDKPDPAMHAAVIRILTSKPASLATIQKVAPLLAEPESFKAVVELFRNNYTIAVPYLLEQVNGAAPANCLLAFQGLSKFIHDASITNRGNQFLSPYAKAAAPYLLSDDDAARSAAIVGMAGLGEPASAALAGVIKSASIQQLNRIFETAQKADSPEQNPSAMLADDANRIAINSTDPDLVDNAYVIVFRDLIAKLDQSSNAPGRDDHDQAVDNNLRNADSHVREAAIKEVMSAAGVVAHTDAALADSDPKVRIEAVRVAPQILGQPGALATFLKAAALATTDPDAQVRITAYKTGSFFTSDPKDRATARLFLLARSDQESARLLAAQVLAAGPQPFAYPLAPIQRGIATLTELNASTPQIDMVFRLASDPSPKIRNLGQIARVAFRRAVSP